jgi:Ca2+-binding RTX toxin-like protein
MRRAGTLRRALSALAIAAAIPLALASHAVARTSVASFGPDLRGGAGGIDVVGSKHSDRISIAYSAGKFSVFDPAGVTARGKHCKRATRTRATCTKPADSSVLVATKRGNDQVRLSTTLAAHSTAYLGPGADRFNGGGASDSVTGGAGVDLLRGRGGDDTLTGDTGADSAFGGDGRDILYMAGFKGEDPDRAIDCGDGDGDYANVEEHGDPAPVGCESVDVGRF